MRESATPEFYIDDHAVLFGLLAKNAETACGRFGLDAVDRAVVSYGRERGQRGAMRCLRDGRELTLKNYMLYGEWLDPCKWSEARIAALAPDYTTRMVRCGWNETWKKYGLGQYGKIYCKWIDHELLYGFNPDLKLEMPSFLSYGDAACEFRWIGCAYQDEAELARMTDLRSQAAPGVVKDFLYHCGHLLSTFKRELCRELGIPKGDEVLANALAEYVELFGDEKKARIVRESGRNFMTIDD